MAKKLILMGLMQPHTEDHVAAFNEWYQGNHVEDTQTAQISRSLDATKQNGGCLGDPPAGYLTIYEFEDAEQAEKILSAYQADPNGWAKRQPSNESMAVVGTVWYTEELSFG